MKTIQKLSVSRKSNGRILLAVVAMAFAFVLFLPAAVRADLPATFSSTADFDAGTKGAPTPADGNRGVETYTDSRTVGSGNLALAGVTGDDFQFPVAGVSSQAENATLTFKWRAGGWHTSNQNGDGGAAINKAAGFPFPDSTGQLVTTTLSLTDSHDSYGVVTSAASVATGDFNVTVMATWDTGGDNNAQADLALFNERQTSDYMTATIDGIGYHLLRSVPGGTPSVLIQPWTAANRVRTLLSTEQNVVASPGPVWLRVTRQGSTVNWSHSTNGVAWVQQFSGTVSTVSGALYTSMFSESPSSQFSRWFWDHYYMTVPTATGAGGFRASGNWTSASQGAAAQVFTTITVTYSNATAGNYISAVSILNSTGAYTWTDATHLTTGTSHVYSPGISVSGTWKLRVNLTSGGTGSATLEGVNVAGPQPIACGLNDAGIPGLVGILVVVIGVGILLTIVGALMVWKKDGTGGIDIQEITVVVIGIVVLVSIVAALLTQFRC